MTTPVKISRPLYPFQITLIVENLEELTTSERELYQEVTQVATKYDISLSIREYDVFHPDDIASVAYLPSYHIYKNSTRKSTHTHSGKVEKRVSYWIQKYDRMCLKKQMSQLQQQV